MARCTFFEGRYFLGHPNTPRPISKDAGTVPAHFDLGFIGQLSKLTFRPTVNVHRVMYAKSAKLSYITCTELHKLLGVTVRRPEIIFLPITFCFFGVLVKLGAPKTPKMGSWSAGERFPIAIGHLGAPSSQRPSKAARTPIEHDERSSSMWRSANPSKGAKASITRSVIPPSVSRAVQCRRSDRTAKNGEIANV